MVEWTLKVVLEGKKLEQCTIDGTEMYENKSNLDGLERHNLESVWMHQFEISGDK